VGAVSTDSTVTLITNAVAELKSDPEIGRAEALRRSMLSMIDTGKVTTRVLPTGRRSYASAKVERDDRSAIRNVQRGAGNPAPD
jgi:hypothetical protein